MPSLPTDLRDAEAAITGRRFVSLRDAPFYRASVNTGDGDTSTISTVSENCIVLIVLVLISFSYGYSAILAAKLMIKLDLT